MIVYAARLARQLNRSLFLRHVSQSAFFIESKDILLDKHASGLNIISMNAVEKKNTLNKSFVKSLTEILNQLKSDRNVKVVILKSSVNGIFSAGADLKERINTHEEDIEILVENLRMLSLQMSEFPTPTIAALDGLAVGGGLEMALSCDIRVASDKARLGLVETRLAIIPGAGGTQRLSRIVGPSIAKDLIFTGRILEASEANEMKLVNYYSKEISAFDKALELAEIMLQRGPIALRAAKVAIDRGIETDLYSGLAYEKLCYSKVIPTSDRIEGLKAFFEKRTPVYKGN